jgi:hypothetical protein
METADIPKIQESSHIEITNEDNVMSFFDVEGTVHFEFIPHGQRLKQLREAVRRNGALTVALCVCVEFVTHPEGRT